MGVSASTLRFYDKEGLLPFVRRENGRRVFEDEDFAWLRIINCLKNTGMPIRDIREYLELCQQGDESLEARQQIILRHKATIEEQIKFLQSNLEELAYKAWYYETAIAAGTEKIHSGKPCSPTFEPDRIPKAAAEPSDDAVQEDYGQNMVLTTRTAT